MACGTTRSETARLCDVLAGGDAERLTIGWYQDRIGNRGSFSVQQDVLVSDDLMSPDGISVSREPKHIYVAIRLVCHRRQVAGQCP
jgi:hypothetical protein